MAIYDLWLSRNNGPTVANYVGHAGRLFYDPTERVLRISDGTTAGGEVFNGLITVNTVEPTNNFQGQVWLNPQTFELSVYHNGNFIPTIDTATSTKIGGIKLGPGVTTNAGGQLIIDSEGLDFSFGDLASTTETYPVGHPQAGDDYAVLSTINANEDLYLVSNGTGSIDVIGEFNVYKTDGDVEGAISVPPIFTVKGDGQIRMLVPGADSAEGALSIIGGLDGVFQAPVNTGVMLHITGIAGTPGVPSRVYNDAQNAFAAFVSRRYNNTAASPSAVLADQEIMRLSGTAHNGTEIPGTANQRIVYVARGNQTLTNQGGAIELWATPLNSITLAKVATVDSTGIILESGKALTGNVSGNASTATSAATLTTARNINGVSFNGSADITVTAAAGTLTGNTLASGVTASSLTSVGTLTNLAIAANGTITTPRIVINDGGIRTVSGGTTCTIDFATDSMILWTAPTGTAVITLSNYTAGARVKLIIAMTTSRDVTYGISSAANSSTGLDNWNGSGAGDIPLTNTAMHLEYTCISALAAGCYVAVTASE
jgi:hypothetical protein